MPGAAALQFIFAQDWGVAVTPTATQLQGRRVVTTLDGERAFTTLQGKRGTTTLEGEH